MVFRISFLTLFVQAAYYLLFRLRYGNRTWFRRGRFAYLALAIFTQGHLWYYVVDGRDLWPYATHGIQFVFYMLSMAWLFTLICLTPFALWISLVLILRLRRRRVQSPRAVSPAEVGAISRAALFKRGAETIVALAPALGMAGISSGLFLGSREIVVTRRRVAPANPHEDLKGLRLVQLSDIHVGSLVDERYLKYCAGIIAGLRAHMLVVTGDIIDLSNYHAPIAGRFFRSLEKHFPLGIHGVLGNHDFFDHGAHFARIMRGGALNIMRNEEIILRRGRGHLRLMGLEYPWPFRRGARARAARVYYNHALNGTPPGDGLPRIVLNHHPGDFAWLRDEAADLVLSGHTHGGQVAFTSRRESLLSPISLMYPYYDGVYNERGTELHVSRGLGHSIPLRINRPPEINFIELV